MPPQTSLALAAALASAAAAATAQPAPDPDMLTILDRSRALFEWPAQSALPDTVAAAKGYAAALNASCFWPDIDYNDPHDRANWLAFNHVGRVVTMVQAVTTPGSPAFEDTSLFQSAHCALDAWIFHEPEFVNDNW
jgi:hypothetical protein